LNFSRLKEHNLLVDAKENEGVGLGERICRKNQGGGMVSSPLP
jgi:hypothetical protein